MSEIQPRDLFADTFIQETTKLRYERGLKMNLRPSALGAVLSSCSAGCHGSPGASSVKSPGLPWQSTSTTLRWWA